jgi:hypothetical protein
MLRTTANDGAGVQHAEAQRHRSTALVESERVR